MLPYSPLLALATIIAYISRANANQNGTEVLALAGFFPLSKSWASLLGRQDLVASQLALQHVNENGILPGYNMTLDVYDNEVSDR